MIIEQRDWWHGDRFKAKIYAEVRQMIFTLKSAAHLHAPRRKTDITYEVAEAVVAAAAVAIGWDDNPERWQDAAEFLRETADAMERDGLRSVPWGERPAFDPTPVTYPAVVLEETDFVVVRFPGFPEAVVQCGLEEDAGALASRELERAVMARLTSGEELPPRRALIFGEVEVTLSPDIGGKVLSFLSYGQRPKAKRDQAAKD